MSWPGSWRRPWGRRAGPPVTAYVRGPGHRCLVSRQDPLWTGGAERQAGAAPVPEVCGSAMGRVTVVRCCRSVAARARRRWRTAAGRTSCVANGYVQATRPLSCGAPDPALAGAAMSRAGITAAAPIAQQRGWADRRRPVCGEAVEHGGSSFLSGLRWRERMMDLPAGAGFRLDIGGCSFGCLADVAGRPVRLSAPTAQRRAIGVALRPAWKQLGNSAGPVADPVVEWAKAACPGG
jgi:hypothetical protein